MPDLTTSLAADALREAVADLTKARADYDAALASRDDAIRAAAGRLSSPKIEAITGLSRETVSRIKHRRVDG